MEQENTEVVEETTTPVEVEKPKSFDDILTDKEYQKEFDRRVSKALDTAKEKWTKELEAQKTEAERLAKLTDDEKHKEELDKANFERDEARRKLNAYELKDQVLKDNPDLPRELVGLIDFNKCNTAEEVQEKVNIIQATFNSSLERRVNDAYKEKMPKTVADTTTSQKRVSRESY